MPVGYYQLFKFSLASEAVIPDYRIILAPHFRSCPPLPFPPCVLEWVMGIVFARRARPIVWTKPLRFMLGAEMLVIHFLKGT